MEKEFKSSIKNAGDWEEIASLVQGIDENDLNTREYDLIYRNLERTRDGEDLKFAVLSNHTLDLLPIYLSVLCSQIKLKIANYVGPFNQYFQELLADTSGLQKFNPDLIYLDLSIPNLSPTIYQEFLELDTETKEDELTRVLETIENVVSLALKNTDSYILLSNFVQPSYTQAGIADYKLDYSETEWYFKLNLKIIDLFRNNNRVFILDKSRLVSRYGSESLFNSKMYYLAKMEIAESGLQYLAHEILRYIVAMKGQTKKCLVLDLDNTLWGGVIGEDGIDGIKIGKGYPEGEVFHALQAYYRTLKQRGVILAIASKNNPEDAEDVFKLKDDMPLTLGDFAITRINWNPKSQSISEMIHALNIGKDSAVFIDDNPVERAQVSDILNEVKVPTLQNDPTTYLKTIQSLNYFEKLFITTDDSTKADQYKQNAKRDGLKHEIGDMNTFLAKLGTVLTITKANTSHTKRIHQLFTKTNQFNVTTKRYNTSDIDIFINDSSFDINVFSVSDNFGDLGIIGLVLTRLNKDEAEIDSFILSCRAMGRGIETAVMNILKNNYLLEGVFERMTATYIPTKMNMPVLNFFNSQGFAISTENEDNSKRYELRNVNVELLDCPGIEIKLEI